MREKSSQYTFTAKAAALSAFSLALSGCSSNGAVPAPEIAMSEPQLNTTTQTEHTLKWLPKPKEKVAVAVYGVNDQTGAFKPTEGTQSLTRAVTQGATPILLKALHDAGNRGWFTVIEREKLDNLLKERQIILQMRERYLNEDSQRSRALPSLLFAGIILEGAITGYDSNVVTGGAGARYLGIGANSEYREDSVSVYLRAVSVKTGEVLLSITSEQRVASVLVQGNAFKFVAFRELLEAEAGYTMNQPRHLAVRQALEKAVYGLIIEGAKIGMWEFEDEEAGAKAIDFYKRNFATDFSRDVEKFVPSEFYAAEANRQARKRAEEGDAPVGSGADTQDTGAAAQARAPIVGDGPTGS